MVEWASFIAVLLACAGAWSYVVAYALLASFWRSRLGWHLWLFGLVIGLISAATLAGRIWGPWPLYPEMMTVLYLGVAVLMWQRVWLLLAYYRRGQRVSPEDAERPPGNV